MDNGLSIFSLIINAGWVVKAVMLVLILMSIYSWTIIMSKKKTLMDANKDVKAIRDYSFTTPSTLAQQISQTPYQNNSPIVCIFNAGYNELTGNNDSNNEETRMINAERAYRTMNTATNNQTDKLNDNLSILAMIASSSPYIGLFGTVWGIMHSFIGLASVKQATISIVAPGIAEALIATAFGLFAAIPATIAYNRLSTQVAAISNKYVAFVEDLFIAFQK